MLGAEVRASVSLCVLATGGQGAGQRRATLWWPREGTPGGGQERQHWARTVGSWQRPSRRSVSQKPKDRRSRSQPRDAGGGSRPAGQAPRTAPYPPQVGGVSLRFYLVISLSPKDLKEACSHRQSISLLFLEGLP